MKCNDSHKMKTKGKEDGVAMVATATAETTTEVATATVECDTAIGQKKDRLEMHSSDLETNVKDTSTTVTLTTKTTTTTGTSSKMQNVTRILINSTNPQRQPNGKYIKMFMSMVYKHNS